ncbi:MAG: hypothetical protein ACI81T_002283 [Bacteroidia bacterium]|jgi:uncharacterized protein YbbC (DUF1343 family)
MKSYKFFLLSWLFLLSNSCTNSQTRQDTVLEESEKVEALKVGAEQLEKYLPLLKGKKIALVVNQTSTIGNTHLVDSLVGLSESASFSIEKIFAPEHGFRGTADAGEKVKDGKDTKTGLPIISLYGKNKKLSKEQLSDIQLVVFDIQDVGARFYTYISSMHYVMEACAESNIPVLILDRPNPNGYYVDGPILELSEKSFVGMHPIPIVHGCTVGELAKMINGENWLKNEIQTDLTVIPVANYTHQTRYSLPVKPSPNLPNDWSISLYPSLCLFEGTNVSIGRGTDKQFQVIGHPTYPTKEFSFTPKSMEGAKYPKHKGKACYGKDLTTKKFAYSHEFFLTELIDFYQKSISKKDFFIPFFTNLAGTKKLQQQIEAGKTEAEIRKSWQADLQKYKAMREKYLLYND